MKKSYLSHILVLVITSFLFTSCLKTEHTVRVKNSYIEAFTDVSVRGTSYGRIESGSTTSYKPIEEGSFTISGSTVISAWVFCNSFAYHSKACCLPLLNFVV